MLPSLHIPKSLILIALLHAFLSINLLGQNWLPLEIGNRWDFRVSIRCHGGTVSGDTISVEVVGDTIISGQEYFILSRPFYFFDDKYLRMENDSLYCFDTEDSMDCLMYAFNQLLGTIYYSCRYDSSFYSDEYYDIYFGYPDTQQVHSPYYEPLICFFSKKFGLSFVEYFNPLCDYQATLSGCIISGITYGQLLVSVDEVISNSHSFKLEQNFPNPFNPTTQIRYSVINDGIVSLKVYDVLGKEVAVLVDEEKPAGKYEVKFDASNLSSGIYFYQLKTGNFADTKKMIFLK